MKLRLLTGGRLSVLLGMVSAVATAGCTAGYGSFGEPMGEVLQVSGPVALVFKYPENVPVRYAFKFSMSTTGAERSNEVSQGVFHIVNEGTFGDEFNRLRIRRQETERKRVEKTRVGETIESTIRDVYPQLSPNLIRQDPADTRFTFPVDFYGRFAVTNETPCHFLFYDSLACFLPAMNRKDVTVGEEWNAYVPVILGFKYVSNEFAMKVAHKIEQVVQLPNGHKAARIVFTIAGRFDTGEDPYATRFTDAFRSGQHILNTVEGSGAALFDMDIGLVVWKKLSFKVTEERSYETVKRLGGNSDNRSSQNIWQTDKSVYNVKESWRYVAPDEPVHVSG